jgi:predicted dehydrogenase
MKNYQTQEKIRYAVVGLGHIAQAAVLPAFRHAKSNSTLTALVSGDTEKLNRLGEEYKVEKRYLFSEFEEFLNRREVDAIYISAPNLYHRKIMETAARYGVHVLCEKPLAVTTEECLSMINEAKKNEIFLMVAYRLHFAPANLRLLNEAQSKKIGDLKIFNSNFSFTIKDLNNIRLDKTQNGGGPLHDIGVYCINSARKLFQTEPLEVFAMAGNSRDSRFKKIDEAVSCILKFPEGKIASFSLSFNAFPSAEIDLIGTKGKMRLENAYKYNRAMNLKIYQEGKLISRRFPRRDQFAEELQYFSDCIQRKKRPSPCGEEGTADLKIIEALLLSLDLGLPIKLEEINKKFNPSEKTGLRASFLRPKFINSFTQGESKK